MFDPESLFDSSLPVCCFWIQHTSILPVNVWMWTAIPFLSSNHLNRIIESSDHLLCSASLDFQFSSCHPNIDLIEISARTAFFWWVWKLISVCSWGLFCSSSQRAQLNLHIRQAEVCFFSCNCLHLVLKVYLVSICSFVLAGKPFIWRLWFSSFSSLLCTSVSHTLHTLCFRLLTISMRVLGRWSERKWRYLPVCNSHGNQLCSTYH